MARPLRTILVPALLVLAGTAACGDDTGSGRCSAPVPVSFSSLSSSEISVFTLEDTRIELLEGGGEGYHDGTRWTLLLLEGARLGLTPPCDATELEVVLDQSQVGLEADLYAGPLADATLASESSTLAGEPIAGESPYERWTIALPPGSAAGYVELRVPGALCEEQCTSVLLRSVTFR